MSFILFICTTSQFKKHCDPIRKILLKKFHQKKKMSWEDLGILYQDPLLFHISTLLVSMLHFSTVEQKPTIIIMMAKIAQRSEREIVRLTLWESMLVTSVSHPLMISVGKLGFLSLFGRWVWKECHQRSDDDTITIKTVPLYREYALVATWKIFSRGYLIFKLCVQSNLPLASWHIRGWITVK